MENTASNVDYGTFLRKITEVIKEVFVYHGFVPDTQCVEEYRKLELDEYRADLVFEKNKRVVLVEVLPSSSIHAPIDYVYACYNTVHGCVMGSKDSIPIIVCTGIITDQVRSSMLNGNVLPGLCIIDIKNLLFMVRNNESLKNKLVALLPFSIDELIPEKVDWEWEFESEAEVPLDYDELINRVEYWNPQEHTSREYEVLCEEVLRVLFADDLTGWFEQRKSDDDLFRFDLICKITNGNSQEFWRMMEQYFRSKYIVFEFKNYSDRITQKEVFTTVKYLYVKALRGVAILISVFGTDEHAEKAIRGILREEGKLIVSLSNKDLVEMLKMKRDNRNPSDYLSNKLDVLLIDLEK